METWIEIGGLSVRAPVTAFMNLLLSAQCCAYYRRLRAEPGGRSRYWSLFFLAMAAATLAGAPKHGLRHVLSVDAYSLILWISSLGSGASVYFAQRATLASRLASNGVPGRLCTLQLVLFLAASAALGPEMWLVVANTAVGLVPVIGSEALSCRRGATEGAWIVAGLGVSLFTGVVYVGRYSLGVWFNHIDVAHTFMALSFYLIVRGAIVSAPELRPGRGPAGERVVPHLESA